MELERIVDAFFAVLMLRKDIAEFACLMYI